MNICVVGVGYVGLVTAACFSEFGIDVTCVDCDAGRIERLGNGVVPIFEPGLEELVRKNLREGRLHFTTDLKEGVERARGLFERMSKAKMKKRRARFVFKRWMEFEEKEGSREDVERVKGVAKEWVERAAERKGGDEEDEE